MPKSKRGLALLIDSSYFCISPLSERAVFSFNTETNKNDGSLSWGIYNPPDRTLGEGGRGGGYYNWSFNVKSPIFKVLKRRSI